MSEETNQLYHYTSMNALFHILDGIESRIIDDDGNTIQELTLRATHYEYLNDKSECKMLTDYYSENAKLNSKKKAKLTDAYIVSFSKRKDNLTMYRHYGNAKGVSLNFDVKLFNEDNKYKLRECDYISIGKEYLEEQTKKIISALPRYDYERILKNIETISTSDNSKRKDFDLFSCVNALKNLEIPRIDTNLTFRYIEWLNLHIYALKHYSFKPEKEKRLIILKDDVAGVKFFEKNGLIKPYVEIKIPVTALKQIWLAPGCDEELSRKSILMLLKSKDVTHITENDIIHSKHPYIDR